MRSFLALICLAATLVTGVAVATASPADVIADYEADGRIDGTYSPSELSGALEIAHRTRNASYGATAAAIEQAQAEAMAGIRRSDPGPAAAAPPPSDPPAGDGGAPGKAAPTKAAPGKAAPVVRPATTPVRQASAAELAIPTPPLPEPTARVPWPFMVLSLMAGLLALGGVGAGVYRRIARR